MAYRLEVEWIYREGKEMNSKQLEIYIHIPFCVQKCDYCDFLSISYTKLAYSRMLDLSIIIIYKML